MHATAVFMRIKDSGCLTQTENLLIVEGGGVVSPSQTGRGEDTQVHVGLQSEQGDIVGADGEEMCSVVRVSDLVVVILGQNYLLR